MNYSNNRHVRTYQMRESEADGVQIVRGGFADKADGALSRVVDCFILAGGLSPWLKEYAGTEHRCLARIGDKRIIDYILDALQESGCIRRIVVAARKEVLPTLRATLPAAILLCEAEGDLPATAYAAAQALGEESTEKLLGVCDDIPLLTPLAVREFLADCHRYPQGELYYPIIPQDTCLASFPEAQRTYGKLADGVFTGGNMMLVAKRVIPRGQQKAREIFARRKSPLKLCNWLGWSFIVRLLLHSLTVAGAEKRTTELLEMNCKAVITRHAGVGMDIDKPADLKLAARYLSEQDSLPR